MTEREAFEAWWTEHGYKTMSANWVSGWLAWQAATKVQSAPLLPDVQEKYNELLMAVGNKYAGETRHETALRYIKRAEECTVINAPSCAG